METPKEIERNREIEKDNKMNPSTQMDIIIENYLANNPAGGRADGKQNEVEIRFGSDIKKQKISQIDYENVIKTLYGAGFTLENPDGIHSLRIFHEYIDKTTGSSMMSNIRTEVVGINMIKEYCKSNNLQTIINSPGCSRDSVIFTQKTKPKTDKGAFQFRVRPFSRQVLQKQEHRRLPIIEDDVIYVIKYARLFQGT